MLRVFAARARAQGETEDWGLLSLPHVPVLGAAALLAGIQRNCVSLSVILMEGSNTRSSLINHNYLRGELCRRDI